MRADELAAFLRSATIPAAGTLSNVRELHRAYRAWSESPVGLASFARALADSGAALEAVGGEVWAHDLRLSDDGLALLLAHPLNVESRPTDTGAGEDAC